MKANFLTEGGMLCRYIRVHRISYLKESLVSAAEMSMYKLKTRIS